MPNKNPDSYLICDASLHPQAKIGVLAILVAPSLRALKEAEIQLQVVPGSSIARLELMAALWAMRAVKRESGKTIRLVTDCRAIDQLPGRREKLEERKYQSGRTGLPLVNADLYREFFKSFDELRPIITWIKGHSPSASRNDLARVFAKVDQAARKALREHLKTTN